MASFTNPLFDLLARPPTGASPPKALSNVGSIPTGPKPTTAPQGPPAPPTPDANPPGRPPAPAPTPGSYTPGPALGSQGTPSGSKPPGLQPFTVPRPQEPEGPQPAPPAPPPTPQTPAPAPAPPSAPAPAAPPPPGAGYQNMPHGWIGPPEPDSVAPRGTDAWRDAVRVRRLFIAQYLAQGGDLNDVVDKYNEQGQLSSDWKLWTGDQWLPEREEFNAGLQQFRSYIARGLIKQDPATGLYYNPPPGIVSWQDQWGNHVPDPYAGTNAGPYHQGVSGPPPPPPSAPGFVNPLAALFPNGVPSNPGPATRAVLAAYPGMAPPAPSATATSVPTPPATSPVGSPQPAPPLAQQAVPPAPAGPAPAAPPAAPTAQPPQQTGVPSPAPQAPAPQPTTPTGAPIIQMSRVPSDTEAELLPPGAEVETPVGTWRRTPDGKGEVVLNAAGQEAYRAKAAEIMGKFGNHPFATDPLAPQPPVIPGRANFNPFSAEGWVA